MPRFSDLALAAALLAGCAPPCDQLCAKLDRCGIDEDMSRTTCTTSCEQQRESYRRTPDENEAQKELRQAFQQHLVCLGNKSCSAIEEGECYDPDLFLFGEP